jgi:hypothetical protein
VNKVSERLMSRAFECDRLPVGLCDDCQTLANIAEQIEDLESQIAYLKLKSAMKGAK